MFVQDADGSFIYMPKEPNIYQAEQYGQTDLRFVCEDTDDCLVGREEVWCQVISSPVWFGMYRLGLW